MNIMKSKNCIIEITAIILCLFFSNIQADAGTWKEEQKIVASDGAAGDSFGSSVSISGDRAIVGSPYKNNYTGLAYIFRYDGSKWVEEQKLVASDGRKEDCFGYAVSISGDRVIIGAINSWNNFYRAGAVYIFKYNGTQWIEEQKLVASDRDSDNEFGSSVCVSEDRVIIGSETNPYISPAIGSAYIFRYDGSKWIEEQKLLASDGAAGDQFGIDVLVSGDCAIIGASDKNNKTGAAYIFKYNGTKWIEEQKLLANDSAIGDGFGCRVSISSDRIIIGATGENNNTGTAYFFKYDASKNKWTEEQKLLASDGTVNDRFGIVSISGDRAIIGAFQDDDKGKLSGSAYVFKYNGSKWIEEQKLLASDGTAGDYFGSCDVSISGDRAIVGAYNKNNDTGAAYIFKLEDEGIMTKIIDTFSTSPVIGEVDSSELGLLPRSGGSASVNSAVPAVNTANNKSASPGASQTTGSIANTFNISGTASAVNTANNKSTSPGASQLTGNIASTLNNAKNLRYTQVNPNLEISVGTQEGKVYLFDDKGKIFPNWPQPTNGKSIINRPSMADIDNDTADEVVACNEDGVWAWKGNGTLAPGWPHYDTTHGWANVVISGPVIADIDGDGELEILVSVRTNYQSSGGRVFKKLLALSGDGRVKNTLMAYYGIAGSESYIDAVGDLEGDGTKEIVIREEEPYISPNPDTRRTMSINIIHYDGTPVKGWPKSFSSKAPETIQPALCDIDNDGKLEVIAVNRIFFNVAANIIGWRYDGTLITNLLTANELVTNGNISYPILGNIDSDGKPEIVVSETVLLKPPWSIDTSSIFAFHNNGKLLTNWPAQILNNYDDLYSPIIADINGDGRSEVFGVSNTKSTQSSVIAIDSYNKIAADFPKYVSSSRIYLSGQELSLAVADLDGNGDLEIVALGDLHNLHILPIKGTDNYGKLEWPQYKRDKYNTNCSPQDPRFINRLPRFLNKPSYMKIMEGKLLKFSMYASDPDKNFLDLGIIGLPKGASFKQDAKTPGFSSAEFSWKPTFIQQGQYNVTFTVTDNIGPLVKKNVLIDVIDDPSVGQIDPKNLTP